MAVGETPDDPRQIVIDGYAKASHAYRGDAFELEGSGYEYWLARFTPRLAPGARVLDAGCGNGLPVARALAGRFDVTGMDLSPVQVERARSLVPQARFLVEDMTTAALAPGSFDAIVAFYSIINVPLDEQPALIARFAEWLAPGGWLLAVVGRDPWTGIEENWRGVRGARMYYSHTHVAKYRSWFADAGFAIAEEGREPKYGVPGYSVLVARRGS
jgi:SAM-dependent methyltransferase